MEHIYPHNHQTSLADDELAAANEAVANGEEGAHARLEAAKEEHGLAWALHNSAYKHYLGFE